MSSAEGRGSTLDEAVDAALIRLGKSRRDVDVKVLSETPDETVVEVSVIAASPVAAELEPAEAGNGLADMSPEAAARDAQVAKGSLEELLRHMGVTAQVTVRGAGETILLDIGGRDLGMLIGWRGETLRALQTITNLIVGRKLGPDRRVVVDVERYRERREHTVREIAFRAARQVKVTGDPITLDAMQAFERRAIHLALDGDPDVTTNSVGVEPERRVVVLPRSEQ